MKNTTLIASMSAMTLMGTAQAMDNVKRLLMTPPIIEVARLTQEQQAAIKPVYKAFCKNRVDETNQAALWRGLPAGIGAGYCIIRTSTLLNQAGKSALQTANHAPSEASTILSGALDFLLSGKTYKSIGLLGMSLPLSIYAMTHAARVGNSYYKLYRSDSLAYLNRDLFKQLGNPQVSPVNEQWWRVRGAPYSDARIDLTNAAHLQYTLNGNFKSTPLVTTHIEVPVQHYGNW